VIGSGDLFFNFHGGAIDDVAGIFIWVCVLGVIIVLGGEVGVGVRDTLRSEVA
jgi:hypothetical protein